MELIADLHLHSKYSRAVSQQMVIPEIARWAAKKGIGLVGTGDWTHPVWLRELQANLEETGLGIYKVKSTSEVKEVRFLLSTEIASIYSQGGKLRRVHTLVFAPNFQIVEKINEKLRSAGANLMSDGRPMTGLSVKELAEIVFSVSEECLVVPSHAWTPWFGIYGDKGGFDSLEEAFGDLAKNIYAIETGLSSSPEMNWRVKELDNRAIVSFSDAHSGQKIGREATVFDLPAGRQGYEEIREAIIKNKIAYTIEFYPEEGKYHYTGHRNCRVVQSPEETKKLGETCPVCGKPLTVGVMQRVEELASRPADYHPSNRPPYKMLVPLMEILAEALGVGFATQSVLNEYNLLTGTFGSEFAVLLKTPVEEIAKIGGERVAEGVLRVRSGQVIIEPGYDGVFGKVKIWPETADVSLEKQNQMSLF